MISSLHLGVFSAPRWALEPRWLAVVLASLFLTGCASGTGDGSGGAASKEVPASGGRFVASDGRTIDIGKARPVKGGTEYANPHMEKGTCWVAEGFKMDPQDTLYLPPTRSTAAVPDKPEDRMVHELARTNLVSELTRLVLARGLVARVVTREEDIPSGSRAVTLENTILEFSKGGGAARYFVGLYGGGQPVLRVAGTATTGGQPVLRFEARRSGTSAGARLGGAFLKDEDIQIEDIRSLALDLTDFLAAISGRYQARH